MPYSTTGRSEAGTLHVVVSNTALRNASLERQLAPSDIPPLVAISPHPPKTGGLALTVPFVHDWVAARYGGSIYSPKRAAKKPAEMSSVPVLTARTADDNLEVVVLCFENIEDASELADQWPDCDVITMNTADVTELAGSCLRLPLMIVDPGPSPITRSLHRRVKIVRRPAAPPVPDLLL